MKTKKVSRVLALLLSLVMLLGTLPMTALAESGVVVKDSDYDTLLAAAMQEYYDRAMEATTLVEIDAILMEIAEYEQTMFFFDNLSSEQQTALDDKVNALVDAYEAERDAIQEVETDRTIIYPAVDYINAAPFGNPVEGASLARFAMMRAATSAEEKDDGLQLRKTVSEPKDGKYTLTLEAWATGAKVVTEQVTTVPTDIILVLDQSGSMDEKDFSVTEGYTSTGGTPESLYGIRSNLYVKLSEGKYAKVTVAVGKLPTGGYSSCSNENNNYFYANQESLYHKCNDSTYGKVTVTRSGYIRYTYNYTCENEACDIPSSSGSNTIPGYDFYTATTVNQYTFSYPREDGGTETSTVLETDDAPAWDFYQYSSGGTISRLQALKTAVTNFTNSVYSTSKGTDGVLGTTDDVNHRIAVVGFAGTSSSYSNTELFIGTNQINYRNASAYYTSVFQNMNTQEGYSNVIASVGELDGDGSTYVHHGVELANGILGANPVESGKKRNRVIIVFTDGVPGYSTNWSSDSKSTGQSAIDEAQLAKNAGVTVYAVGIFNGANPNTAGDWDDNADYRDKANYYMQNMSSNNGTPQTPSYYLSASNADALNNIFQEISNNIESGGTSVTLDEQAVMQDVLSNQFALPNGKETKPSEIKVYTAAYTAQDTFAEKESFDTTPIISEDGRSISVTNFDFAENWVGTETTNGEVGFRGKKLIIEIPIVVRSGFLGGNGVLTNAAGSGVYEDSDAKTAVKEFTSPSVNVQISQQKLTLAEKNVYLLDELNAEQLLDGHAVTLVDSKGNDVTENTQFDGYDAYVTVDVNGNDSGENLKENTTYGATLVISPTASNVAGSVGTDATAQTTTATGNINVFKPVVTFSDSAIDYLASADAADHTYYAAHNNQKTEWVWTSTDGTVTKKSTEVAMTTTQTPPGIVFDYSPKASSWIKDGVVSSTSDVPVNVTAKIGDTDISEYTTSIRLACGDCGIAQTSGKMNAVTTEFIVHIKNVFGDLIIVKEGLQAGESAIFTVSATLATESSPRTWTIVLTKTGTDNPSATITGLKAKSTFTVTENLDWVWSYTPKFVSQTAATIQAGGEVTVTWKNTKDEQWLYDESIAVNVFDGDTTN